MKIINIIIINNYHCKETTKFQNHNSHKRRTSNHIMIFNILNTESSLIHSYSIILSLIQSQLQVIRSWNLISIKFVYFHKIHHFLSNSPKGKHTCSNTSIKHIHISHMITVAYTCTHHMPILINSKICLSSSHFIIFQKKTIFKAKLSLKLTHTFQNHFIIITTENKH